MRHYTSVAMPVVPSGIQERQSPSLSINTASSNQLICHSDPTKGRQGTFISSCCTFWPNHHLSNKPLSTTKRLRDFKRHSFRSTSSSPPLILQLLTRLLACPSHSPLFLHTTQSGSKTNLGPSLPLATTYQVIQHGDAPRPHATRWDPYPRTDATRLTRRA